MHHRFCLLVVLLVSWLCATVSWSASVTRGPYLQMASATNIVVRWSTDIATDSAIHYGTNSANLDLVDSRATLTTDHRMSLQELLPNTRYFYSIGSKTNVLAGGDTSYFFVTSPESGVDIPTRIWVLGDSGTANTNAASVRDAYLTFAGTNTANLWLMLGDNAYESGTDPEYQAAVFNMYPAILRNTVLWPTFGNHD